MSIRVFFVDSGCLAANGMVALSQFMGHQTRVASRAEQALDEALRFRPDVSLLDWTVRAPEQIRSELAMSGAPIIAVAPSADARWLRLAAGSRFAAVLSLPCPRVELSKALSSVADEVWRRQYQMDDLALEELGKSLFAKWRRLMRTLVIRLYGGMRDGQELRGQRAIELYRRLGEAPEGRSFWASRFRHVKDDWSEDDHVVVDEQRYFVEEVVRTPSQTLIVARYRARKSRFRRRRR